MDEQRVQPRQEKECWRCIAIKFHYEDGNSFQELKIMNSQVLKLFITPLGHLLHTFLALKEPKMFSFNNEHKIIWTLCTSNF